MFVDFYMHMQNVIFAGHTDRLFATGLAVRQDEFV